MKKVLCLLLAIILTMSAACFAPLREIEQDIDDIRTRLENLGNNDNTSNNDNAPNSDNAPDSDNTSGNVDRPEPPPTPDKDKDKSNDNTSGESRELSVSKARALAQTWLDKHPVEESPNTLDDMFFEYTHNNEVYYQFFLTTMQMYWFNILVHKDTGDMLLLLIEDGMDGGEYVEPLDEWYNNVFSNYYVESGIDLLWAALLDAEHFGIVVGLYINWENGTQTLFFNDYFDGWYMFSRMGGDAIPVSPNFSLSDYAIEISFPTTSSAYYLYDNYTGFFGDETFTWFFELP